MAWSTDCAKKMVSGHKRIPANVRTTLVRCVFTVQHACVCMITVCNKLCECVCVHVAFLVKKLLILQLKFSQSFSR